MVYGRLSAGQIRLVKPTTVYDGTAVSNPPPEDLDQNNWKPVVFVEPPILAEGQTAEMHWMEETNQIVQVWTVSSSSQSVVPDPEEQIE